MKRVTTILSLLLLIGCSTDITEQSPTFDPQATGKHSIAVTLDADTRVSMGELTDGNYPLYWQKGDQVVINGVGLSDPLNELFDGEKSAIFTTDLQIEYPLTIIYPGDVLLDQAHIAIPAEQQHLQSKFANGYGIIIGHTVDEQDPLVVKHACGYIKVPIVGSQSISKVILNATAAESLTGAFAVAGDKHKLTAKSNNKLALDDYAAITPRSTHITITTNATLSATATDFYFAIPAGTYKRGFTLTVVDTQGNSCTKSLYSEGGKSIEAGVMTVMSEISFAAERPVGIYTAEDWVCFATSTNYSAWSDSNKVINLYADIDLSAYNSTCPATLDSGYSLNGNGHTISGLKSSQSSKYCALLFSYIADGCTVKNLNLGKSAGENADSHLTVTTASAANNTCFCSPFCTIAFGDIENCKNYANTTIALGGKLSINAGGITCGNHNTEKAVGHIIKCHNYGNITLSDGKASALVTTRLGGIVGRAVFNDITECENYGTISSTLSIDTDYQQLGGIVGVAMEPAGNGKVKPVGCKNFGDIYLKHTGARTKNGCAGGICGAIASDLSDCHNHGNVTLISTTTEAKSYCGGIVGWWSVTAGYKSENCTNRGAITMGVKLTSTANAIGGIVGYAAAEGKGASTNQIIGSTNYGAISATDTGYIRMGGISGSSCLLSGNTNFGDITVERSDLAANSFIGGITGVMAYDYTACKNYGNIKASSSKAFCGGISGWTTSKVCTAAGCAVDCTITGVANCVGLAIGSIKYNNIFGTATAPTKFAGTLVRSGVTTNIASQQDIVSSNLFGVSTASPVLTYARYEATKPAQ